MHRLVENIDNLQSGPVFWGATLYIAPLQVWANLLSAPVSLQFVVFIMFTINII